MKIVKIKMNDDYFFGVGLVKGKVYFAIDAEGYWLVQSNKCTPFTIVIPKSTASTPQAITTHTDQDQEPPTDPGCCPGPNGE